MAPDQPFYVPPADTWGEDMLQPFTPQRAVSWGLTMFANLTMTSQMRVLELLQDRQVTLSGSSPSYILHIEDMVGYFKLPQSAKIACLLNLAKSLCRLELQDLLNQCTKLREADLVLIDGLREHTRGTSLTSHDAIQLYLSMGTNLTR